MSDPISSQAMFWLTLFTQNPELKLNYKTIVDAGVSRAKSVAILKELKDHGHVKVVKHIGGGSRLHLTRRGASNTVGSGASNTVGSGYASTAVTLVSYNPVSYTAVTTDKATNKFFDEVEVESEDMGYDFFESTSSGDDDLVRERAKHMAQKKAEYAEMREAKAQERKDRHRSKVAPASWTCKDVAYEFADRLLDQWEIKPFSVTQSRFIQALGVFRKQHDTNGELELTLINLFFSSLEPGRYTDGNHLWRAFLYKAPALLQTARELTVSTEERETAIIRDQELANKKLSLLDEDDDVQN